MASFIARTYFLEVKTSTRKRSAEVSFTVSKPLLLRDIAPRPFGMHAIALEEGSTPDTTEDRNASGRPISNREVRDVGSLWIKSLITVTAE